MSKKIEILGKTFNSEEETRKYYKEDLRKKLPELKQIEGFPIGEDEDILALSNPPYYTACPNPYINDFIEKYGTPYNEESDDYHREPFVGDVSEGKNNPVYNAHSYHTKVSHFAVENYIKHYTDKGEIVLDGFSGTGMTGVAAKKANRNAIISDLSVIATFISSIYNSKFDIKKEINTIKEIIANVEDEFKWLYQTQVSNKKEKISGELVYSVISEVLISPYNNEKFDYYSAAYSSENNKVLDVFKCPYTDGELTKRDCKKSVVTKWDTILNKEVEEVEYNHVFKVVEYSVYKNGKRKTKRETMQFSKDDYAILDKIDNYQIPYWIPTSEVKKGDKTREFINKKITHVSQAYTKRNLIALSALLHHLKQSRIGLFIFNSISATLSSKLTRYNLGNRGNGPLTGTIFVPSLIAENNVFRLIKGKLRDIENALSLLDTYKGNSIVSLLSATNLSTVPENSIDYIFTDPPFGQNLMYSDLNFLWESWLNVSTNIKKEAIINGFQHKSLHDYNNLMFYSFKEYFRVLKPKRWITVEFHNSKSSVWNGIQESIIKAGFVIANVSTLDKQQGSFNQVVASGATKTDLVISAYKPSKMFEEKFLKNTGEGLEIDFIHEFLHQQPVRPIMERTEKMLYSKMLSYYIQHGYEVRYDAKAFYQMLRENFAEEDGYWFNANQINSYMEYKKKMKLEGIDEIKQGAMMMFVTDEKSALVWLHNFLNEPKSFSDIHTAFTQLANIQGDEVPELRDLLEQNFIVEGSLFRRPQSEPEKNIVIEKREKQLMRQFESLLIQAQTEKKKIKTIRKEAVQLGFEHCYKEKRFQDILTLAGKLNRKLLEENAELNEFVEAAEIMVSGLS